MSFMFNIVSQGLRGINFEGRGGRAQHWGAELRIRGARAHPKEYKSTLLSSAIENDQKFRSPCIKFQNGQAIFVPVVCVEGKSPIT